MSRKLLWSTGLSLALLVLVTRVPFLSRSYFEFDSVNLGVALSRFSLSEVTPHMPGYILHILFARILLFFTHNANSALVWESVLVSMLAEIALWRAAAKLRGERVGLIVALVWLTLPMFWFYGEVATVYIQDAFFASLILYLGISLYRSNQRRYLLGLFASLSLAAGFRQSTLFFLLPAIVYLIAITRQRLKDIVLGLLIFLIISSLWICDLLMESSGWTVYWHRLLSEHVYRSQSVLFGNSVASHLGAIEKFGFYLLIALIPLCVPVAFGAIVYPKRFLNFARRQLRKQSFRFVILVALPAALFYLTIYFMKPGYVLIILPSIILCFGIALDQFAIFFAEWEKKRPGNRLALTRPIITRNVSIMVAIVLFLQCAWFLGGWRGTEFTTFSEANTFNSIGFGPQERVQHSGEWSTVLFNRAFQASNDYSIRAQDSINSELMQTVRGAGGTSPNAAILSTFWHRWLYTYDPSATVFDIQLNSKGGLDLGKSQNLRRVNIYESLIDLRGKSPVLILVREDHPDFPLLESNLELTRVGGTRYLGVYECPKPQLDFRWRGVRIIK